MKILFTLITIFIFTGCQNTQVQEANEKELLPHQQERKDWYESQDRFERSNLGLDADY